jgi:hypothetical protein
MRSLFSSALVTAAIAVASVTLAACGEISTPPTQLTPGNVARSGGSSGGGGGGGGTTTDPYSVLPTTPPAPDILVRESFAVAALQRPAGGKGDLKGAFTHVPINGFWVEYPGSKNTQWLAPAEGQTWRFCGGGDDNTYELPSPLEQPYGGCVASEWFDTPTSYPTALMPITVALPSAGYEFSMEGYPAPIAGGYIAIGFTNSAALNSNLTTSGSLWLRVTDSTRFGVPLHYELRTGSLASGQLLASGDAGASGWNHMGLRYSPTDGTVTLSFADVVVGTYPVTIATPKYLAFEGIGILDDVVLRR